MTSESRPPRRLSWAIFAYLFVTLAYFVPGASWSPVARFSLTRAIVERGQLEITPYAGSTGDRARVGDRYFSDKAPIPSLLAVPVYAVHHAVAKARNRLPAFRAEGTVSFPARRVTVSPAFRTGLYVCSLSTAGLAGALLGVGVFRILRRRFDAWSSCVGAVATLLATPLLPYGTSFFGHTIGAAFLVGAAALLDPLGPSLTHRRAAQSGLCLALAVGSEYLLGIAAIACVVFAVSTWKRETGRRLAWLALGALGPAILVGLYHTACFGAPWRVGYGFIVHPAFEGGQSSGLFGITYPRPRALFALLFGEARGLFYLSPLCLVAVFAGVRAFRRDRDPLVGLGLVVLTLLWLVNASYFQWDGGWATGPRHMVPGVALLGVGVGAAFAGPRLRPITAAAAGLSATVLLATTAVGLEAPPTGDAIFDYLVPALREGRIARISGASNLGILLGLSPRASLAPVFAWALLGIAALRALCVQGQPREPRSDAV